MQGVHVGPAAAQAHVGAQRDQLMGQPQGRGGVTWEQRQGHEDTGFRDARGNFTSTKQSCAYRGFTAVEVDSVIDRVL